jgi:hypothetical protein
VGFVEGEMGAGEEARKWEAKLEWEEGSWVGGDGNGRGTGASVGGESAL